MCLKINYSNWKMTKKRKILLKFKTIFDYLKNNKIQAFLFVFLLSLSIRLLYVAFIPSKLVWYDEIKYNEKAENLLKNGTYGSVEFAPGEPFFIFGIYKLFGESIIAVRIAEALLGALSCIFLFILGNYLFSFGVGLTSAVIMSFYPFYIFSVGTLFPIVLFLFFLLILFIFLYKMAETGQWGYSLVSGILMGIETLVIPTIIFMFPVFFLWLYIMLKKTFLGKIGLLLLVFLAFGMTVFPWSYSNTKKMGKFILVTSESGHALWQGNNEYFDGFSRLGPNDIPPELVQLLKGKSINEQDQIYRKEAIKFITSHPKQFIILYIKKFINFWRIYPKTISNNQYTSPKNKMISIFSYGILLFLSLIGLWQTRNRFMYLSVIPLSSLFFAMGYSLFLTSTRYRLPIDAFIILFASVIIAQLAGSLFKGANGESMNYGL